MISLTRFFPRLQTHLKVMPLCLTATACEVSISWRVMFSLVWHRKTAAVLAEIPGSVNFWEGQEMGCVPPAPPPGPPCQNPQCPYQKTWHGTHCCQACVGAGDSHNHGPKCQRRLQPGKQHPPLTKEQAARAWKKHHENPHRKQPGGGGGGGGE